VYTFQDHNVAYKKGLPQYALRNWYLWNVRSALIDETTHHSMADLLLQEGWAKVDSERGIGLYTLDDTPSYFMNLDSSVLVIGRSASCVASLLPWVTQGRNPDPLKYPEEYVDLFKCIVLYDLPSVSVPELERKIIHWVSEGKQVVADLSFSDSIPELLGVRAKQVEVSGEMHVVSYGEGRGLFGEPATVNLSPGRGAVYSSLDSTFLFMLTGEGEVSLCGIRQLQGGDVWFVGGHLPRLFQPTSVDVARRIWGTVLNACKPNTGIKPSPFPVQNASWTPKGVRFSYTSSEARPLVLSVTYTPRWQVTVDGKPCEVFPHEYLLMVMLPAGTHAVTVEYTSTVVATAASALSVCALLWAAFRTLIPVAVQKKAWLSALSVMGLQRRASAIER